MPNGTAVSPPADARLRLTTLGGWSLAYVAASGESAPVLGASKPLALIVYLALSPGRTARREHLVDLLWSDLEPTAAAHALRQTLWYIRQRAGKDLTATSDGRLQLIAAVDVDRDDFLCAMERQDFEAAVAAYGGDFLPGFAAPGGAEFEKWADLERHRLRAMFARAAEHLVRDRLSRGRTRDAVTLARQLRDTDPLAEAGWRLLLEALISAGDRLNAAVEADALERLLAEEEREPEPATRALLKSAKETSAAHSSFSDHEPPRALVAELVGREREFGTIIAAWDAARSGPARHVHVTAPAGLGKTRLLTHVLNRLRGTRARAVMVRANPGARHIPFAAASDIAAALAALPGAPGISTAAAGALVALNPTLSSRFPSASPDPASGSEALRRRTIALGELLAAVSEDAPLAALLDDVHWADPPSRELLAGLAARLSGERVLLVTTARPVTDGALQRDDSTLLALEPLSSSDTAALVASLGSLPDDPWAADLGSRLHSATHGSPLLILETLQLAIERGILELDAAGWRCNDAAGLERELCDGGALRHRIERLDRNQGWLLLLLSVAGTPVDATLLSAGAGREEAAVSADLAILEQRGFALRAGRSWTTSHDAVAEMALDAAPEGAVKAAHTALGQAMAAGAGGDTGTLFSAGRHLVEAGDYASLHAVFAKLLTAARAAGDRRPTAAVAAQLLGRPPSDPGVKQLLRSLPLSTRLGLTSRARIAAAGFSLLAAATAMSALLLPEAPPDAVLFVTTVDTTGALHVLSANFRSSQWPRTEAVELSAPDNSAGVAAPPADADKPAFDPVHRRWAFNRVSPDSRSWDLYVREHDGTERRLTWGRPDDQAATWSPDGRYLAFESNQWDNSTYDIGLMTASGDSVHAVASEPAGDQSTPAWSPDGSRIAYTENLRAGVQRGWGRPCWITPDRSRRWCHNSGSTDVLQIVAWQDARHVLAVADGGSGRFVASIDMETGAMSSLPVTVEWLAASPDARWAVCLCRRPGRRRGELLAFSTESPERLLPVNLPPGHGFSQAVFALPAGPRPGTRLVIDTVESAVPLDQRYQMAASGLDGSGRPLAVDQRVISWAVDDSSVATIDSTGRLTPRRIGRVLVRASAGGWLRDSAWVTVAPAGFTTVFRHTWDGGSDAWRMFGDPMPVRALGPGGVPALWLSGDNNFYTGAYTVQAASAREGLGVEIAISSPLTGSQWQSLFVELTSSKDSVSLASWDHVSGGPPSLETPATGSCGFSFPNRMARLPLQTPRFSIRGEYGFGRTDGALATGRWYTVRIQIFPDGRCGAAVNGRPEWISEGRLPLGRPYRLAVGAYSWRTRIMAGPVEMWTGVRNDVDWSAIDRPQADTLRSSGPRSR